jgi:MOSC domain-containing protein YiiM
MVVMAQISSIVYQPQDQAYEGGRLDHFIRRPLPKAELIAGQGIQGDRKAGRNPRRQLNLLSADWLAAKQGEGYKTAPGQFGEQLIVSGLALESLAPGSQLQLGDEARIEITMPRIGCERLEAAQGKTGLSETPIGMLARVIHGGIIKVGDRVRVLTTDTVT